MLPLLSSSLTSPIDVAREGVCLGLAEVLKAAGRHMVSEFLEMVIPAINRALADPVLAVQTAAAEAFDALYATAGSKVLDSVLPPLLMSMDSDDEQTSQMALNGLRQLLTVRSEIGTFFIVRSFVLVICLSLSTLIPLTPLPLLSSIPLISSQFYPSSSRN